MSYSPIDATAPNAAETTKFRAGAGRILPHRRYHDALRKPTIGKPRAASGAFTLSRKLPKLDLPASAAVITRSPNRLRVGRPGKSVFNGVPKRKG